MRDRRGLRRIVKRPKADSMRGHAPAPTRTEHHAALPRPHARWMRELLLGRALPVEARASCGECVMCARSPELDDPAVHFHPRVKCCARTPSLANFLVGGVL